MDSYFSSYIRVIDIILGLFILWGAYKGFRKGFLLELISLLVFVAGMLIVFYLFSFLFIKTNEYVGIPKATVFLTFLALYLGGTIGLNFLGRRLQEKIDYSVFDDFDNMMGMLTGGFKYALSLSILLGLCEAVGLKLPKEATQDSILYPKLLRFFHWLSEVAGIIAPSVQEFGGEIDKILEQRAKGNNK